MDLMHLHYFRTIAEIGSMTAAARKLGVAQPTLTSAVKRLEDSLETTLLLRNARGVAVTPTGAALANAASQILALVDETEQRIRGLEREEVGQFAIGCHESLGAYFLPDFMADFLSRAAGIDIRVWNGTSADVREAVLRREVHFGLVVNPQPHDELVLVEAFPDAVAVVARRDLVPRDAAGISALLRKGPLIYAGRVDQCRQIVDALSGLDLLPQRLVSTGDLELTKSLLLAGVGVGILPRRVADYGHRGELVVVDPTLPQIADRIVLCWRADAHRTAAWLRTKAGLLEHANRIAPIPGARPPAS
ncbi:MAG: LysR family transcriptional regulator [Deltaproteobacteria bacterium]|nr:LysR family transcriptional regulator [Deltaproteobacteria bacterium]MBK8237425.1 LysR family transcriptional regulator [Deltaproteobacteria bacterium]MBK8720415.1 LysR family transcriptional regulator [Deltaproteobacteria bacterium]MBP7285547.1 LysR family transcriptional regulator [Nannocystaceae bacterium]